MKIMLKEIILLMIDNNGLYKLIYLLDTNKGAKI